MFWFFICYQQAIHEFWGSTQFTIACCCAIVLSLEYYHWHIKYQEEGTERDYNVKWLSSSCSISLNFGIDLWFSV